MPVTETNVIDADAHVVRAVDLLARADVLDLVNGIGRHDEVVETPADVLLARLALVAVEGVLLRHRVKVRTHACLKEEKKK